MRLNSAIRDARRCCCAADADEDDAGAFERCVYMAGKNGDVPELTDMAMELVNEIMKVLS